MTTSQKLHFDLDDMLSACSKQPFSPPIVIGKSMVESRYGNSKAQSLAMYEEDKLDQIGRTALHVYWSFPHDGKAYE